MLIIASPILIQAAIGDLDKMSHLNFWGFGNLTNFGFGRICVLEDVVTGEGRSVQAANVDPDKCRARTNLDILWAAAKLRRVNVLVNCH